MRKIYVGLFMALAFTVSPLFTHAQKHWEAGLALGYTNYMGDMVKPAFTLKNPHPAAQLFVRRNFDAQHSYRLGFLYGKISGSDANYESIAERGVSFENDILEISSILELDFGGKKRFPRQGTFNKSTTPYMLVGLGLLLGKPEVNYSTDDNIDETIDYPFWHVSLPVGFGVKKDIREEIYVGAEIIHRVTLSDNLDGVQESGNAYRNDSIFYAGLTIGFRLLQNARGVPMTTDD